MKKIAINKYTNTTTVLEGKMVAEILVMVQIYRLNAVRFNIFTTYCLPTTVYTLELETNASSEKSKNKKCSFNLANLYILFHVVVEWGSFKSFLLFSPVPTILSAIQYVAVKL